MATLDCDHVQVFDYVSLIAAAIPLGGGLRLPSTIGRADQQVV